MKQQPVIAPSVLNADFARLGQESSAVLEAGGDWLHLDVMDHQFVPNLTVGPMVCRALRDYGIQAPIDVHLMVEAVDPLIEAFAEAGASRISFHPEATRHLDRSIRLARDCGCQVGLVLNPGTPLAVVEEVLGEIDLLLLMTVNPGFGGQAFIPYTLAKVARARQMIDAGSRPVRLQVDGGIKVHNIADVARAGADTFVVGSAIFAERDYGQAIAALRRAVAGA